MFVPPVPIGLLIIFLELAKIAIFAMILFGVNAIRLILMIVPFMIVIVFFVVVTASRVLGGCSYWHDQSGAPMPSDRGNAADITTVTLP